MIHGHLLPSGLLTDSWDVIIQPNHKSGQRRLLDIQSKKLEHVYVAHVLLRTCMWTHCATLWGLQTLEYKCACDLCNVFLQSCCRDRSQVWGLQITLAGTSMAYVCGNKPPNTRVAGRQVMSEILIKEAQNFFIFYFECWSFTEHFSDSFGYFTQMISSMFCVNWPSLCDF